VQTSDVTDVKILHSFHLGELEKTTGMLSYYLDKDYPAGPEIQ